MKKTKLPELLVLCERSLALLTPEDRARVEAVLFDKLTDLVFDSVQQVGQLLQEQCKKKSVKGKSGRLEICVADEYVKIAAKIEELY